MSPAARASIVEGLFAISANPLRTVLSTLGVAIGVAAVIATMGLADGLDRFTRAQIESQTDVQSITVSSLVEEKRDGFAFPTHGFPVFGAQDALDLEAQLSPGTEVTMQVTGQAIVTSALGAPHIVSVTATLANCLLFGRKDVAAGRFFTDGEVSRNAPVVVLSHRLAAELSPTSDPGSMMDHGVRIRGRLLTVVGVMPPYTGERDYRVFVPLRAAAMTFGGRGPITPSLIVRAPRIELVGRTEAEVEDWLARRYHDWRRRVSVTTAERTLEQTQSAVLLLKLTLGSLAAISLVVGGVGIMNVLLASVAERTREIGVRKALGARRSDILIQFLAESLTIAMIGTAVGTVTGFGAATAVAGLLRWQVPGAPLHAAFTGSALATAVLSAAIIGLTFGTFPGLRAARLSPIAAIRHD